MNKYTKEEVANHRTRESCWIVIDKNIYDLTNYLDKHPPGSAMILNIAQKGQEARGMYAIHSSRAKKMWDSFKIGTIVE